MKKSIICFVGIFLFCGALQAQVSSDPSSEFYDDVQIWETQGLISNLPDMRPYPLTIVKKIVNTVIANGTTTDKQKALEWQKSIDGIDVYGIGTFATKKAEETETTTEIYNVQFGVEGDKELLEGLALSYDFSTIIQNDSFSSVLPATVSNPYDDSGDVTKIGSLEGIINANSSFSYGTDHFAVQGGLTRSSFGPFYDTSIVIAPDTYHTGNLTTYIFLENITYQQSIFSLTASDETGSGKAPGKLMALHELSYAPFTWLKLGFFETVIWEDSFEFTYLLPVSYMVAQSLGGFDDNIEMGLTAQLGSFYGFLWKNQILIDDLSMNDIVTLDFDTKIIAALESQLAWTPSVTFNKDDSFCKLVTFDFFFVNAYMYSHKGTEDDYNYTNLTTNGEQLSTEIEPNSYRLKLKTEFEPIKNVTITPFISLMQHGNVNESISTDEAIAYLESDAGEYSTDGSAFNTPYIYDDGYIDAYLDDWFFLEQEHIETTFQTGLDLDYSIPLKVQNNYTTTLSFNVSYTFEYIHNCMDEAGDMFPGETYGESSDNSEWVSDVDDVQDAIDDWVSKLYDTYNHYLTLSLKYQY